jgi:hypothetical protein
MSVKRLISSVEVYELRIDEWLLPSQRGFAWQLSLSPLF